MKRMHSLPITLGAMVLPLFGGDVPGADWSIYGTLVTELNNMKVSGSTDPTKDLGSRNRFTSATSNLGFKGHVQVSPDVKVLWQVESAVSLDGDAPSTWNGRNSGLGLETTWGTVLVGYWDTPYKDVVMKMGPFPACLASDVSIINTPGFRTIGTVSATKPAGNSSDAIFSRRQGNSGQYWSPVLHGWQLKVLYSANEGRNGNINPTVLSSTLSYHHGPVTMFYGHEEHNGYFGLAQMLNGLSGTANAALAVAPSGGSLTSSRDTGDLVACHLTFPSQTRIQAVVERLHYSVTGESAASASAYRRVAWYLTATQDWAKHRVWAGYGVADKGSLEAQNGTTITTNSAFGAKQYTLGYAYSLGSGASLFLNAFGVINDRNASYATMPPVAGGAAGTSTSTYQGGDTRGIGGGMIYRF